MPNYKPNMAGLKGFKGRRTKAEKEAKKLRDAAILAVAEEARIKRIIQDPKQWTDRIMIAYVEANPHTTGAIQCMLKWQEMKDKQGDVNPLAGAE